MYYDEYTQKMFNQSIENFYTQLLLNIDALPQDEMFPLDISGLIFVRFAYQKEFKKPQGHFMKLIIRETRGFFK